MRNILGTLVLASAFWLKFYQQRKRCQSNSVLIQLILLSFVTCRLSLTLWEFWNMWKKKHMFCKNARYSTFSRIATVRNKFSKLIFSRPGKRQVILWLVRELWNRLEKSGNLNLMFMPVFRKYIYSAEVKVKCLSFG